MICATPIVAGPNKGKLATGTLAGLARHHRAGESPCGQCAAANVRSTRAWRTNNPEAAKALGQQWRRDNVETARELSRRWAASHPEARRNWKQANREKVREMQRKWSKNNREAQRETLRRYRARLRGAPSVPFTTDQLAQRMAYWGNACWMCSGPFEHVDHVIPLARGGWHCLSNLRPACGSCNTSKGAKNWREVA
jgi:5-methylcytosine-specific restriction endonuclease McrA